MDKLLSVDDIFGMEILDGENNLCGIESNPIFILKV